MVKATRRASNVIRKTRRLNLLSIEPVCHAQAETAFKEGNGEQFAQCGYSWGAMLDLVRENAEALLKRGIYESALATAIVGCKINNRLTTMQEIERLLLLADRTKLLLTGEPLPGDGPFTVYRGISGSGRNRRIRGCSWTLSLDVACRFAFSFAGCDPAVYQFAMTVSDVFLFANERGEEELVCLPQRFQRMAIEPAEIRQRAEKAMAKQREGARARLASVLKRRGLQAADPLVQVGNGVGRSLQPGQPTLLGRPGD